MAFAVFHHPRALALCALIGIGGAGSAAAHPHVFIDAGLTLFHDAAGRVAEVEVTWRYDELYTLILLQDLDLDPDFDGDLTEDEIAQTLGFDLNWNSGFEGGLELSRGDVALRIGPPRPQALTLLPEGRLETVHRREVTGDPGGDAALVAAIYDPAFYIAFEAILPTEVRAPTGGPAPCSVELLRADLDAAYAELETALAEIGGVVAAEDNFPAVGALFADRLVVACDG
ncbi:hypothetical protein roselon_03099 [Roseibacterium elongatum DSM 19469]|uniref:Polyphosphate kinase n=1 Tax=Roseicyclus elongatus DSM 19469 TaxID=1294273 RepID=W8SS64_9RHOB|nr:DUF1007 family protein [Roseibacterium elongatum]AHM05370.1 hypothetical protein roselon_03099 [Roseibacterium elongatum DSM 19469]